ncbi:MAG: LytTR family DNA-binding domain-containing protein [Christensenella sp.]|nr:LytTR family DNA-binding domain-containing protein [Christensenella sp.]
MFQIAICDDIPEQAQSILKMTQNYFERASQYASAEIHVYSNPTLLLEESEKMYQYDILLLDICMPGLLGTDVAKEFRMRKQQSEIIFLTSSDEFAVEAFAVHAAHYLLKPFAQVQVDEALERALASIKKESRRTITIKMEGGALRAVEVNQISYIESHGHGQQIHLLTETVAESRRTLSRLHEMLEGVVPRQFIAPYKGYLVNQCFIHTLSPEGIILKSGERLPIARRSFRQLRDNYFDFMFRDGSNL